MRFIFMFSPPAPFRATGAPPEAHRKSLNTHAMRHYMKIGIDFRMKRSFRAATLKSEMPLPGESTS